MQMTNRAIISAINGLEGISNMTLPGRIGYTIKQNKKNLIEAYSPYNDELNAIEYEKDSPEWESAVGELLAAEVEVPIAKVSPEPLFNAEYPAALFDALDFMLEEVK